MDGFFICPPEVPVPALSIGSVPEFHSWNFRICGRTGQRLVRSLPIGSANRHQIVTGRSTTVSAEALKWGFWHFGDFSRAYRNCFGELPSDSLRKELGK
jgi:AraC-like DNA-binding protein